MFMLYLIFHYLAPDAPEDETPASPPGLITAKTLGEGLQQRLEAFKVSMGEDWGLLTKTNAEE